MNSKQRKVLKAIFADPVSPSIAWADIESLLVAVGCVAIQGSGSRVKFAKDGMLAGFHRPHPELHAKRYQVKDARAFLVRIGETP